MFKYYVTYTYGVGGTGCYHAELEHPLEIYEEVLNLAAQIASERQQPYVVIQNWKKLQ